MNISIKIGSALFYTDIIRHKISSEMQSCTKHFQSLPFCIPFQAYSTLLISLLCWKKQCLNRSVWTSFLDKIQTEENFFEPQKSSKPTWLYVWASCFIYCFYCKNHNLSFLLSFARGQEWNFKWYVWRSKG